MNQDKVSGILLAGGVGSRLGRSTPKQYLPLHGRPMVLYSYEAMIASSEIDEIIVVCSEAFQSFFPDHPKLCFAKPGDRRQDSVYNALLKSQFPLICIHDAARPFLNKSLIQRVIEAGREHGAAVLAQPIKFTVKQSASDQFVKRTLPREELWEIQTPQVLRRDWLRAGFEKVNEEGLTVTDDVSLAELMDYPVKLIQGDDCLLKVTTPSDLQLAEALI